MKKTILASAVCLALISACSQQDSKDAAQVEQTKAEQTQTEQKVAVEKKLKSGITLENMDTKVRPQDDFYRYVNGAWLDKTEIPTDKSTYGSFTALRDKSREDVKIIIEETAKLESVEQ
ncbi:MAG: peptidase M13, partial [Kangiellaceae bacterium]|nr:peptidase M13 [Kangiellaceae bacterium]